MASAAKLSSRHHRPAAVPSEPTEPMTAAQRRVVAASSLGTAFEWYDFYLYGTLAPILGRQFFTGLDSATATLFALLAFAAGFVARPFGALLFGHMGDTLGRKRTFLVTMLVMGLATFTIGLLPDHGSIGVAAPLLLVGLRLMQGLALGGEYGGAATFIAEHAPPGRRGAATGFLQTTATLGLLLSIVVILATRAVLGEAAFAAWGWRVPFLVSVLLLAVGGWVRLGLAESPVFRALQEAGATTNAPLRDSFLRGRNLRLVLLALFGLVAGQAVVWYTAQFHALYFLTQALKVDETRANLLMAVALALGAPSFALFGAWSDRVGRKPIVMAGLLLAALSSFPLFQALTHAANPALAAAQAASRVVVEADPRTCSFQFNLLGTARYTSPCDIARQALTRASVSFDDEPAQPGYPTLVHVGEVVIGVPTAEGLSGAEARLREVELRTRLQAALDAAGYPARADPARVNAFGVVAILWLLIVFAAMVYGPLAAMLVEMFPARVRYTSMSLPYHVGNGWFGGLLPTTAFALVTANGNMYSGLWYGVATATMSLVVGGLFIRDPRRTDLN